jgi:hypothetical protein
VSVDAGSGIAERSSSSVTVTVATTPDATGTVDADPAGPWIVDGTTVELTASPVVGWVFDRWEGDVTGAANPTTFAMDAPKSVTAVFGEQPGTVSGRAIQQWDGAPLVGLVVHLIANGDTTTTTTDANGDYEFVDVAVGAYTVAADAESVIPFGQFAPSREQAITVGRGEDVTGIDFSYQRAQIEIRTLADNTNVSVDATVTWNSISRRFRSRRRRSRVRSAGTRRWRTIRRTARPERPGISSSSTKARRARWGSPRYR